MSWLNEIIEKNMLEAKQLKNTPGYSERKAKIKSNRKKVLADLKEYEVPYEENGEDSHEWFAKGS